MNLTRNNSSNNGNRFEIILSGNTAKGKNYIINEDCCIRLWSRIQHLKLWQCSNDNFACLHSSCYNWRKYIYKLLYTLKSNYVLFAILIAQMASVGCYYDISPKFKFWCRHSGMNRDLSFIPGVFWGFSG